MANVTGIIKSYDNILGYYTVWLTTGQKAKFKAVSSFQTGDLIEGYLTTLENSKVNFLQNVTKISN